jgi:DNA-binding NarL/FixJ family response regulator
LTGPPPRDRGAQDPTQNSTRLTMRPGGAPPVRSFGRLVFSHEIWRLLARSLGLSERECQIVQALFDDQKESAIGSDLGISQHTVHTHIERLYRKLKVNSRAALVGRVFVEYLCQAKGV